MRSGRHTTRRRVVRIVAAGCAAVGVASACGGPPSAGTEATTAPARSTSTAPAMSTPAAPPSAEPSPTPTPTLTPQSPPSAALDTTSADVALLDTLPVKGRAPKTGYDRAQFGQAWSDDVSVEGGRNGCDTRNDILRRDLSGTTVKAGTNGCVVLSGTLDDPYSGMRIDFTRGADTSEAVQIDHVVSLSDAWQKGAQQLDENTRRNFANDPLNLQATDGPTNQQKGDGDAATWLPPNKSYRCTFVARQVAVKARYQLWVTAAEKDAIARVLG